MTKKDYELIAGALNAEIRYWYSVKEQQKTLGATGKEQQEIINAIKGVVATLAGRLQAENTRFDRVRFYSEVYQEFLAD